MEGPATVWQDSVRCIEERKRRGEAGETEEDWQAVKWHSDIAQTLPSRSTQHTTTLAPSALGHRPGTQLALRSECQPDDSGDRSDGCAQDPAP